MHADVLETCVALRADHDVRVLAPDSEVRAFARRRGTVFFRPGRVHGPRRGVTRSMVVKKAASG